MQVISDNKIARPKVSIVIPSYNRVNSLSQTVDSILNQKCGFEFELVIGDDKSTDNVRHILINYQKKYPEKIVLIFHDTNIGLGANWAICVKHCRGKYVANCDNDDYWHNPEKLQLQVDFLEQNREYGMVHTDYRELNRKTGVVKDKTIHDATCSGPVIKTIFEGKFKCCNSSVMYRKSVLDEHVLLDDYISYQFPLQDWNTWICIANYTKFYCMPVSTTTVGIETESITRPLEYMKVNQRFIKEKIMYKYLCDKFPEDLPFDEAAYDHYVNSVLLNLAYSKNDYLSAKEFAGKIIETDSTNFKAKMARNWLTFKLYALAKLFR
jgi:glycosyltransferase involved in cell wall biosynthesis